MRLIGVVGWRLVAAGALAVLPSGSAESAALEFWHPWPQIAQTMCSLAASYRKQTGVTVNVRSYNPNSFKPWSGRSVPDIVGVYYPIKPGIEGLVRSGMLYNVETALTRGWYTAFWPALLETFTIRIGGGTGIYGVPLTGYVYVFVYNKDAFKRAGVRNFPRTWSEMMTDSQQFRRAGIKPCAGGFGSNMPPLAAVYEWSYLGVHRLTQTYFGRYSYTAPEWISYLTLYSEMRAYGFTDAPSARATVTQAIKAMLDGRVAMVFADPSFELVREHYKPGFKAWSVADAPVDQRAQFLPRLPGGVAEGVVINNRSQRKTEAINFIRWLTLTPQQVVLANAASVIPATKSATASSRLEPHLRTFAAVGMNDQAIDLRVYENPLVLATFYGGVRDILAGKSTPSQVARRTQAVKRR